MGQVGWNESEGECGGRVWCTLGKARWPVSVLVPVGVQVSRRGARREVVPASSCVLGEVSERSLPVLGMSWD